MSDPLTVGSALGAAKTAFDLTKAFVDVRDAAKVQAVKFELLGLLLQAQETEAALVAEKRELEQRLRDMEHWEAERARYQLAEVGRGTYAYLLKAEAQGSDPQHMACANCFQQGRISPLQRHPSSVDGRPAFDCNACKARISARPLTPDDPEPARPSKLAGRQSGGSNSWMK